MGFAFTSVLGKGCDEISGEVLSRLVSQILGFAISRARGFSLRIPPMEGGGVEPRAERLRFQP